MRISDKLGTGHPVFSFEFFPPKTEQGEHDLWAVLQELTELKPSFVSVTYGAGGSTRSKTVSLTQRIQNELGIDALAHLTCVGATRDDLKEVVQELKGAGLQNVLALRGDPPKGQDRFVATRGGLRYGSELTSFIREEFSGDFCIGGACYPEKHLDAASAYEDLNNLKLKQDAGAEFFITQLFFDNRIYFDFVDRARAAGITVPIIPGLMPIQSAKQVKRFTKMCGASIPQELLEALESKADSPEEVRQLGIVQTTIQALGLIQGGAPGVHFYTLNRSTATRAIVKAIRMNARI